jgi:hypothetical protein
VLLLAAAPASKATASASPVRSEREPCEVSTHLMIQSSTRSRLPLRGTKSRVREQQPPIRLRATMTTCSSRARRATSAARSAQRRGLRVRAAVLDEARGHDALGTEVEPVSPDHRDPSTFACVAVPGAPPRHHPCENVRQASADASSSRFLPHRELEPNEASAIVFVRARVSGDEPLAPKVRRRPSNPRRRTPRPS